MVAQVHSSIQLVLSTLPRQKQDYSFYTMMPTEHISKKWGDTEIAERGRSVLVMRARYRSAGLTPHQRGWTDAG